MADEFARGMSAARMAEIRAVWDAIEESESDISTERLMQMTADACSCDVGDVAEALFAANDNTAST